jgi:ubiquinone/menaquinone biosynthesis C-methylase UbiE
MATGTETTTGKVLHWPRAYDLLVWVLTLGHERRFREQLVRLARLGPNESVLDVGCGTGALALAVKDEVGSGGQVCGIDPSLEMVARARRKAAKAGVDARFETAVVEALPFPDATFDAVLSSLMLHHLSDEGPRRGVGEIGRVLKPGGTFLAVDIQHGTGGRHHRLFHCVRRHADFDLNQLSPALDAGGFEVLEQGTVPSPGIVGLPDLGFILAVTHSRYPQGRRDAVL